jgi:hypothetical protein
VTLAKLTIPALIAHWARIVDDVERSAGIAAGERRDDPLHDFRADADVRHELATRIRVRPMTSEMREMLAELDGHYRAATDESVRCIHGEDRAVRHEWSSAREWYYWRVPRGAASV